MEPPPGELARKDFFSAHRFPASLLRLRAGKSGPLGPGSQQGRIVPSLPMMTVPSSPQLINLGPSSISQGVLELSCPHALDGQQLLYVTRVTGLSNCTTSHPPNPEGLEVRGLGTGREVGGTRSMVVGEGRRDLEELMRMCLELGLRPLEGSQKSHRHLEALRGEKIVLSTALLSFCLKYPSLTPCPGILLGPSSAPPPLESLLQTHSPKFILFIYNI